MTLIDIDQWLRKGAAAIDYPLHRKKLKKRHCDVTLGLEVYRTRFGGAYYVEFAIYSKELPRPGPYESPSVPVFTRRLKNSAVMRSGGDHPDFVFFKEDNDRAKLAFAREQIVAQGNEWFAQAHSLATLGLALRSDAAVNPADPGARHLAARIEAFLTERAQSD